MLIFINFQKDLCAEDGLWVNPDRLLSVYLVKEEKDGKEQYSIVVSILEDKVVGLVAGKFADKSEAKNFLNLIVSDINASIFMKNKA